VVVINEVLLKSLVFTSGWYFFRILIRSLITERYLIFDIKKLQNYLLPSTENDGLDATRVRIDFGRLFRTRDFTRTTQIDRNFVTVNLYVFMQILYCIFHILSRTVNTTANLECSLYGRYK